MTRIINPLWITGASINLMATIKLVHINEIITITSGIGAIVLIIYQILAKASQYKQNRLKNKDLEIKIKHDEESLKQIKRKNK